jgi:hypothetical protein
MFDRLDIVEAHYAYCSDYHSGQWSELYRRLCRIRRYYKPSPLFNGCDSLSDNAKDIYNALVEKGGKQ